MSPTVIKVKGYRFFFFSKEEERPHIHVNCSDGEAKFWMKPEIVLANNYGLSDQQLLEIMKIIKEKQNEIEEAWGKHFST